jgi:hypothetical protein
MQASERFQLYKKEVYVCKFYVSELPLWSVEFTLPWHKTVFGMMVHKYVLMCENGLEGIPD